MMISFEPKQCRNIPKIRPEHLKELQHHLVDFNYTQMYYVDLYNYRPPKP